MSIRPLDMQVMIPKTPEISQQYQDQSHRVITEQQQFAQFMEKQISQNKEKVQSSNKPEYAVNKDAQNKNQYQKSDSKKKKQDKDKNKKEDMSDRSSIIDIRI
ncbi:MAG: hypothetical protein PWP07_403 [Epulopiscium sp.]|jgi:DNA-binding protein H-NS|uniref:Uncharacterized protein n=1 Tax=Defluviitalea raffinosedens TaxID=1450156 RepID=A0A7C8LUQ4_9FIRM|nr:hypothetical protein [Defluviitalea raffinosedens]KAE9637066.1 hypothetical protein GND95_01135 [Defluviitalea raffinosedens]MBZ4669262.1 hypothetical protein [Defluviitaleaceae bacterium]MDK2787178.1 hypothetical protein [Candidatus Epulonipiscium sp.]HHW67384.1 hypothetical protein [Candidatus Epulonipiscium sp.]